MYEPHIDLSSIVSDVPLKVSFDSAFRLESSGTGKYYWFENPTFSLVPLQLPELPSPTEISGLALLSETGFLTKSTRATIASSTDWLGDGYLYSHHVELSGSTSGPIQTPP